MADVDSICKQNEIGVYLIQVMWELVIFSLTVSLSLPHSFFFPLPLSRSHSPCLPSYLLLNPHLRLARLLVSSETRGLVMARGWGKYMRVGGEEGRDK